MRDGGSTLPGTESESEDRIVVHADMDCFYAACERLREPALRGEPVVVGMGYEPGDGVGAVATASYEARAFGVESAQPIAEALERLPRKVDAASDPDLDVGDAGFYRPVDMEYYRSVSQKVREILHDAADTVREVSIDEAYLDVSSRIEWHEAQAFGHELKHRIADDVGVTASVGIAPTMATAKIASDADKPDGLVVVPPGSVESFLAPLDVEALHGVGPVTARELRRNGIETIRDLADADRQTLIDRFGERGEQLYRRSRGEDDREVTPRGRPKSLSRESAFKSPTADVDAIRDRLRTLAAAVAERARRKEAFYRTIGIKVVTPPYEVHTRERSLPGPVDAPELVESTALDLVEEFDGDRIRKVGVRVSNLSFDAAAQADLDTWQGSAADPGSTEEARSPMRDDREAVGDPRGQASLTDFAGGN